MGQQIVIRRMRDEDIAAVRKLYESVEVTTENYMQSLDPLSDMSFEKIGGLFRPQSRKELEEKVNLDTELFLIAENEKNEICGMLWHRLGMNNYKRVESVLYKQDYLSVKKKLRDAYDADVLAYGGEIMIKRKCSLPKVSSILFYALFSYLKECGFTLSTGEVYRLKNMTTPDGRKQQVTMLNQRSYNLLCRTGGIHVGEFPEIGYDKLIFSVHVTSYFFIWDVEKSVEIIKDYLLPYDFIQH